MVEIVKSATFDRWVRKLKHRRAAARALVRIDRLAAGNSGCEAGRGGISELRIVHGLGYRVAGCLIYGMNLTLDGYIAAPGDDLGWSGPSDELFQWWLDQELAIGLLAYGASCGRR